MKRKLISNCPICGEELSQAARSLKCPRNHSFDLAREGYVNLLLAGPKQRRRGDNEMMLQARRRFLGEGHYRPLAEAINERVTRFLRTAVEPDEAIVEAGCGEGYYLGQLQATLEADLPDRAICYFGVDIARPAVRLAARQYRNIVFFVADLTRKIFLTDASVQVLLNIFAPLSTA